MIKLRAPGLSLISFLKNMSAQRLFFLILLFFVLSLFLTFGLFWRQKVGIHLEVLKARIQQQHIRVDFSLYQLKSQVRELENLFVRPFKPLDYQKDTFIPLPVHNSPDGAILTIREKPPLSPFSQQLMDRVMAHGPSMLGRFLKHNPFVESFYFIEEDFFLTYPKQIAFDPYHLMTQGELHRYAYPVLKRLARLFKGWSGIQGNINDWHIRYVHPCYQQNLLLGFFVLNMPQEFFAHMISKVDFSFGHLFLVDKQRRILAHKTPTEMTSNIQMLSNYVPRTTFKFETQTKFTSIPFSRYISYTLPLTEGPWKFVFVIDTRQLFWSDLKRLAKELYWIVICFAMLALCMWVLIRYVFMQPLKQFMNHINHERLNLKTKPAQLKGMWQDWGQMLSAAFQEKRGNIVMLDRSLKSYESQLSTTLTYLRQTQRQLFVREKLASVGVIATGFSYRTYQKMHTAHTQLQRLLEDIKGIPKEQLFQLQSAAPKLLPYLETLFVQNKHNKDELKKLLFWHKEIHAQPDYTVHTCHVTEVVKRYTKLTLESFFSLYPPCPLHFDICLPPEDLYLPMPPYHFGALLTSFLFQAFQVSCDQWLDGQKNGTHKGDADQRLDMPRVRLVLHRKKRMIDIMIQDNGPQVPDAMEGDFFNELPQRTGGKEGGESALWTSLSQALIQQYNGTFSFQSQKAHTTFKITLPLAVTT